MLLKIVADLKPDFIAACYDLPGPTIRHAAYAEYKGTRVKLEDALTAQLDSSRKVFEAFSIPMYDREGFEADDLLGTIAFEMKKHKNVEVIIASGDMDTLQLVDDDKVKVYTLKKGINDTVLYDAKAVMARYGFGPELIPDYKGLRGDPSDNIKGVPGIGEKGATDLLTKFGTVEQIYKALKKDEEQFIKKVIKKRVVELLKEHKEEAELSKALATDSHRRLSLSSFPGASGARVWISIKSSHSLMSSRLSHTEEPCARRVWQVLWPRLRRRIARRGLC